MGSRQQEQTGGVGNRAGQREQQAERAAERGRAQARKGREQGSRAEARQVRAHGQGSMAVHALRCASTFKGEHWHSCVCAVLSALEPPAGPHGHARGAVRTRCGDEDGRGPVLGCTVPL
eukprot:SAG22_NODE_9376_length_592_cov_1.653144_1_plen_119_part_00